MQKTIERGLWEVSLEAGINWDVWAVPLQIAWWHSKDVLGSDNKSVTLQILCFTFHIDVWKWFKKERQK